MIPSLISLTIRSKRDVVIARQRAHQIAGLLGFSHDEQTLIAATTFEMAHEIYRSPGSGSIQYDLAGKTLRIFSSESTGRKEEAEGKATAIPQAKKKLNPSGVRRLIKYLGRNCRTKSRFLPGLQIPLPEQTPAVAPEDVPWLIQQIADQTSFSLFDEICRQNQELLRILENVPIFPKRHTLTRSAGEEVESNSEKNPAA
jgi:hypothetical protein